MSAYELAKRFGMALSNLYNMFERGTMPKLETLKKICNRMDVSLSDFFVFLSKTRVGDYLTETDMALIEAVRKLTERNQEYLIIYAKGMNEAQHDEKK